MATKSLSILRTKTKVPVKAKQLPAKSRVCVGLSGGVDSSVAAALLKEQGYEVVGVYMKNWNTASPTLGRRPLSADEYRMECPWYDEYLDAKRVALHLGIPFYLWDFREAYKKKVFDHFIDEFATGRTPNPDVYCNSEVKFEDFQRRAIDELSVGYVATGHYAAVTREGERSVLSIPADLRKDQTYFLYRLSQAQLDKALFPLAGLTKTQVRALAKRFNLPTKYKRDSQGLCFIGPIEVRSFIGQWLVPKIGEIVDQKGQVLGQHQGAQFYTIGEKIAVDNQKVAELWPEMKRALPTWYIADKGIKANQLVAVPGFDHPALYKSEASIDKVSWINDQPRIGQALKARLRHGGELVEAKVTQIDKGKIKATVSFSKPQRAVAPGQHLVLYGVDNHVLGGGVIQSSG